MEYLEIFKDWLFDLGEEHEVNPWLLAMLYLISKPLFFFFLGWTIKNMKNRKPFMSQLLTACVCFSIPYLYVIIAGRNISVWVYVFIAVVYSYGGFTIYKKVTAPADPTLPA
ncbi:hypothetical protein BC343_00950 [Mucilaginibacter pedocola]|uniref:Uncharacterized protein n=2 Tax=Mucilaginibacter pedocola TaxID=1792845 RepID=A0A1S9PMW8_9SPHI|nr:hypothetical protein BC343_00950 [Mucilaginibacter pedocola]